MSMLGCPRLVPALSAARHAWLKYVRLAAVPLSYCVKSTATTVHVPNSSAKALDSSANCQVSLPQLRCLTARLPHTPSLSSTLTLLRASLEAGT